MWRPKQEIMSWTTNLMQKFSTPRDRVTVFCAATCFTAKARTLPDHHSRFVGSDVEFESLSSAKADLELAPTSQVLNPYSETGGSKKVKATENVFKVVDTALFANKNFSVRDVPPGLVATLVLPSLITQVVSAMGKYSS